MDLQLCCLDTPMEAEGICAKKLVENCLKSTGRWLNQMNCNLGRLHIMGIESCGIQKESNCCHFPTGYSSTMRQVENTIVLQSRISYQVAINCSTNLLYCYLICNLSFISFCVNIFVFPFSQ